ncbi:hypothetical protein BIU95_02495 [Curtobacterium sp. MCBA15_007]|uniref:hypothetical protein n=1 Tax=unclassified Curtobacterium TaxID=257496 RepID=UPI0008DDCF83|nr:MULTISPECIES: hypothetical protein [unclassified Curtobacterium]MBF4598892.1 hypothetical protein [Curtobacterium sp. VKM Ac-1796]MBF4610530.1 hypothetical protein [Curtobacterium sp. VKM Ac-2889]OII09952.1 hypothetical protein BIU95_02495 [Curtobacterium sp. MCBA15_007]
MQIAAPGTHETWLPVPNDLGGAPVKKIMKWAQPAVRDVLPGRLFSPHPKQMFLQTLLGSVAQATEPNEQYFVHLAELPEEVLMVRVRWEPAEQDVSAQLRRLVGPGNSTDVEIDVAEPAVITPGVQGLRAALNRAGERVGWVAAFVVDGLATQLRMELPPEFIPSLEPDVESLARSLRAQ